jgi:nucleoid DNA-binding protein
MKNQELIDRIADEAVMSKADTARVMNAANDVIAEALKRGDDIMLRGVGKLQSVTRKGRKSRNPKTGEEIDVPPRKTVVLRASKVIKEKLNQA